MDHPERPSHLAHYIPPHDFVFVYFNDRPTLEEAFKRGDAMAEAAAKYIEKLPDIGLAHKYKYEGEYNTEGQPEGRGTARWPDGEMYEGEWRAGQKEGRGAITHPNGDVYDGEWRAGKKEGRGICTLASGAIYEGMWKDDLEIVD